VLEILGAYADRDEEALKAIKKGARVATLDSCVVRCFVGMSATEAMIDGSFSTKQVLDLGNEGPDTPTGRGDELDLGGFSASSPGGNAKKPAPQDDDDDLC
jgi:hypothetical protein